jgi:hypothetical protein
MGGVRDCAESEECTAEQAEQRPKPAMFLERTVAPQHRASIVPVCLRFEYLNEGNKHRRRPGKQREEGSSTVGRRQRADNVAGNRHHGESENQQQQEKNGYMRNLTQGAHRLGGQVAWAATMYVSGLYARGKGNKEAAQNGKQRAQKLMLRAVA